MPLVVAQDYILMALRKCGQMRPGYVPQVELLSDGLTEWGMMFDSWQAERTMGFSIPQYTYAVTGPGSQSNGNGYQIGPTAADWVGPRPESIVRANCKMTSLGSQPVYIHLKPISAEEWAGLSIRQIPGINVKNLFYYDPQFPNGVFNVFPPLTGNSIELFTWPALAAPTSTAAAYSAPPGYQDAVVYSLAERLWPLCTHQIAINKMPYQWVAGKAYEAREKVRLVNRPIPRLRNDFSGSTQPAGYYDANVSWTGEPY